MLVPCGSCFHTAEVTGSNDQANTAAVREQQSVTGIVSDGPALSGFEALQEETQSCIPPALNPLRDDPQIVRFPEPQVRCSSHPWGKRNSKSQKEFAQTAEGERGEGVFGETPPRECILGQRPGQSSAERQGDGAAGVQRAKYRGGEEYVDRGCGCVQPAD